jgi:hypothetical protein
MGCQQDFSVTPWRCVTSGGHLVWAADTSFVNAQFLQNYAWAKQNGIPVERDAVAPGEYTGLRILPQQPADNPYMGAVMGPDHIQWVAMDASRDPVMRPVGAALGVPRHPLDVGEDVDTVPEEVSEFNWYNDSRAAGGSGFCQGSKVTQCLKPLSLKAGWSSFILPGQVQIVFQAMLSNDPRPFFMHQSNLTGDRLGYPLMDEILSAYRAVYGPGAPIANLPMDQDGAVLRDQQLWAQALRAGTVTAWVQGHTVTISGPPGTPVPVTVPAGSTVGSRTFGSPYSDELSDFATLGSQPLKIDLNSDPY